MLQSIAHDDLEIENIEYLEENPNVEEYIEEPNEKDELEDNFYPNAIHCLLDLYKTKYESLNTEDEHLKTVQIWRDIAKSMQESFFEFSERQIRHKYRQLRKQYFEVQTKEDIENFDYFELLHDIYRDQSKENIVKDLKGDKTCIIVYKDEVLLQSENLESNEHHLHGFKSEEIVHKEHEFIDMVEKELQAMEDGLQTNCREEIAIIEQVGKKRREPESSLKEVKILNDENVEELQKTKRIKRFRSNTEFSREQSHCKQNSNNEYFQINHNDFSLYHYNKEQERRHRESVSLLEKSLQIQERALEQQQQLLQELIKRLPS